MYERVFRWVEVGVLAVVAVAVGGAVLIMFPAMKGEVYAAWIQAVGSIAAIGAAIFVMNAQHRHQQKAEESRTREERANLILAGLVAAVELQGILEALKQEPDQLLMPPHIAAFGLKRLELFMAGTEELPIWKMGVVEGQWMAVLKSVARNTYTALHVAVEEGRATTGRPPLATTFVNGIMLNAGLVHATEDAMQQAKRSIDMFQKLYFALTGRKAPM